MPRFKQEVDRGDGWCEWVYPIMHGYKMACCDCGLVHNMNFRVVRGSDGEVLDDEEYRVEFQVSRNARSTGQLRRHMGKAP
ncbi:MAG TPA: hypothetical protein VFI96_01620 [Longimicrobiaceae bacterium]|nr:hypothetical protein [Longimicrobiaceae bacterium]